MPISQDLIHKFEVVGGSRKLRYILGLLAVVLLVTAYNLRVYRNMYTQEAMDTAQLGRNIAEGKGYTTMFIRPFSLFLVKRTNEKKMDAPEPGKVADYARIKEAHPDISNPPVYPVVLAGLMKVLPFDHTLNTPGSKLAPFWNFSGQFRRYQPDFLIAIFNELLLFVIVVLAFFWARRMFDSAIAWTSAALLICTELLWRFCVSGLSTMLLILIFMGLVWCLTLLENETREPKWGQAAWLALGAATGLLVGFGGLTRYAFGWLIIPVLIFFILFAGRRGMILCLVALTAFAMVMAPWIIRNFNLSGEPFGTATYSLIETTGLQPGHQLQRSLNPDIRVLLKPVWGKLLSNTRVIIQKDLFNSGGGWIVAFFLAGLMIGFRHRATRRMRYFLLLTLGVIILVQALGRTQLSEDSPDINSENLLVLLLPLIVIYGVGLFFALFDQITVPIRELRWVATGLFGALVSLPMISALLPKTNPISYPPYYPPIIQQTASWMRENELMMSDVPWAVAWYGRRQCVWLTRNAVQNTGDSRHQENFFTINDYLKAIGAIYLTPLTMDGRFVSDWIRPGDYAWGSFILGSWMNKKVPKEFPLREMPNGFLPEQLFLADWPRWRDTNTNTNTE